MKVPIYIGGDILAGLQTKKEQTRRNPDQMKKEQTQRNPNQTKKEQTHKPRSPKPKPFGSDWTQAMTAKVPG